MVSKTVERRFGVIGAANDSGTVDVCAQLTDLGQAAGKAQICIVRETPTSVAENALDASPGSLSQHKIRLFDAIRDFERQQVDTLILPSFRAHVFLDELRPEIRLPVVDLMAALRAHVEKHHPNVSRIGVLTSDFVEKHGLFERCFAAPRWQTIHAKPEMRQGIPWLSHCEGNEVESEPASGTVVDLLAQACRDLLSRGAEIILPGAAGIASLVEMLKERGMPVLNVNRIHARHAIEVGGEPVVRPFKIGVVGGVGPAATVDFYSKIVRNTPARRDQEHIKVVVEQNPQIPDRTENLIGTGVDPTLALYATCKRLEADEASVIAIPCNTAHAFVRRLQPHLSIPIVNMLSETVAYIRRHYAGSRKVGLLATTGTVRSRVYHEAAEGSGLEILVPDAVHQAKVMNAIYGEKGVKAGFTDGECKVDLLAALAHLVERGAEVAILGCTELPLGLAQDEAFEIAGRRVVLLDPTEILARKCVALAGECAI